MLGAKDFLAQECRNVRGLLQNTLRYNYGSESSTEIYRECHSRLDFLENYFRILEKDEVDEFWQLWVQLSQLSALIGNLERSNIEEFSWPFAEALKELATDICKRDGEEPPLFLFSSDDELSSYEVETEQYAPGLKERPLFSIKFPKSLKSFVLLHAILAHELGHVAYAVPKQKQEIKKAVVDPLIRKSALETGDALDKWIERTKGTLRAEVLIEQALVSWPEELYCDLFGLLMIGPSYIGANSSLLLPFDMQSVSGTHPPGLTRIWMLNEAVKHLGWASALSKVPSVKAAALAYFRQLEFAASKVPLRYRLLKSDHICEAVDGLQRIMKPMGSTLFKLPPSTLLREMLQNLLQARPPISSKVDSKLKIKNDRVDFRWILFAGWLAWHSPRRRGLLFADINLLCERGVLLQSAVEHWATNGGVRSASNGRS